MVNADSILLRVRLVTTLMKAVLHGPAATEINKNELLLPACHMVQS